MKSETNGRMQHHQGQPTSHSIPLLTLFGIEIRLDPSVLIIFFLIVYSLGNSVFPQWHPDWGTALSWSTAFVSGILFFVSLLAHEFSHSLVAQRYGIAVPRITLFLFGGVAEISEEPDRPKIEFFVAIAGPLMSILISIICTNLAFGITNDPEVINRLLAGDEIALAELGPVSTSLFWLGTINMVLGVFNLIPGFPMDGGRVFRAIAWALTGDQVKATRWASNLGRYFGWSLMALGFISLFQGAGFTSIWWILIGWFISNLAATSYKQLLANRFLQGFKVADLMRTKFELISPKVPVTQFIDQHLLRSTQQLWPVVEGNRMIGVVTMSDVVNLSPEARASRSIRDILRPAASIHFLKPDTNVQDALKYITNAEESVPVVEGGMIVGLIQRNDIIKWMSLHEL
jgi:Zn-dependent protease/predicted transcriptional regulator